MKASAPLSGADAFLLAVERMMAQSGQGQHLGLTVLRLGEGCNIEQLRSAVSRVADASPVAAARLRHPLAGIPRWEWNGETRAVFPFEVHPVGTTVSTLAEERLNRTAREAACFDVIPAADGTATLLMSWRHALLDGKGAELLLAEIARLAEDPTVTAREESWGPAKMREQSWRQFLGEAERFKDHFNKNSRLPIRSLSGEKPQRGRARFILEHFTPEETAAISQRAAEVTRGMFALAWFMAVAVRAHRAVFLRRGTEPESYQASCAVQERKKGARHPIWQNQVSQLFFCVTPDEAAELPTAARVLQEQFQHLTRAEMQNAFGAMTGLLRRMPTSWYLNFVRRNSGGHITSFFYSHTGQFLSECESLAGAPVVDGWHVPSVSTPPGTGVFFSERKGRLTATIAWRDPAINEEEVALMRQTLRAELLGA